MDGWECAGGGDSEAREYAGGPDGDGGRAGDGEDGATYGVCDGGGLVSFWGRGVVREYGVG